MKQWKRSHSRYLIIYIEFGLVIKSFLYHYIIYFSSYFKDEEILRKLKKWLVIELVSVFITSLYFSWIIFVLYPYLAYN